MYLGLKDKWERLGICETIMTSRTKFEPNLSLICTFTTFWSLATNCFHFSEGSMTPTMLDYRWEGRIAYWRREIERDKYFMVKIRETVGFF
jgi:hypothetical protein